MLHVVSHHCLFPCINVSTSVQTAIAEKLTGFQLTNKPLHCMQPELSLLYIVLKNKIKTLKSLKSGKTDFKAISVYNMYTNIIHSVNKRNN
jgi:hypothetical protein